ncbi:MAG TPA: hypothetical protein VGR03_01325 [Candidatus Acidoferrum sp.]|nr:hypothetical protein [Candidatus Acidoferrum sp.]
MRELRDEPWARPLLDDINATGGLTRDNKTKLFELRFGYALRHAGITPRYEVAGEAQSTLDFGFNSAKKDWLVELMRLEETQAAKGATRSETDEHGTPWVKRVLATDAEDPKRSEEGETLKAVERICQKCEHDGRPHKFPAPAGAHHAILVDIRTFLNGGDEYDRVHVGLGGEYVPDEMCRRYWDKQLISGVFSPRTTLRGAAEARSRVHFLGFVREQAYAAGAFGKAIQFIANPNLLKTEAEVRAAIATWPLQPAAILNVGRGK